MAIFALIAKVFMQRRQEKLQTKDLVFNNIKVAAEGYACFVLAVLRHPEKA